MNVKMNGVIEIFFNKGYTRSPVRFIINPLVLTISVIYLNNKILIQSKRNCIALDKINVKAKMLCIFGLIEPLFDLIQLYFSNKK